MNMLPQISLEQQDVINGLETNNNVIVNSVAGSGKTTCNLHIALHFPEKRILLLTYNAKLKLETRIRVKNVGIENIEIHSYHSFCVKYYHEKCFNDGEIKKVIETQMINRKSFEYDIIILDEAQDISPLYFQLICKIFKANNNENVNICVLGDEKQSIFGFNGADERFITFADKLFTLNTYPWKKCKLSQSFRITSEMSEFLNGCVLNEERIFSKKVSGIKPRYIICDTFGDKIGTSDRTFDEVKYYLGLGYLPSDIFILAPSLKTNNSPIRILENKIKTCLENIPVYVPIGDDTTLDSDVLEGKLVFSSFHQVKGLERKVVIVFNFDNSYFKYYKKDANPNICPNEIYVATTRSLECLSLFHHINNDYLPFICINTINKYCYVEKNTLKILYTDNIKPKETSPTKLLRHIADDVLDQCYNYLDIINIQDKKEMIHIPLKTRQKYGDYAEGSESVCEITGLAIPCYFELKLKGKIGIFEKLGRKFGKPQVNSGCLVVLEPEDDKKPDETISNIVLETLTVQQLLYIANYWNSDKDGFLFKIKQITNYDWLSDENLQYCMNRLDKLNFSTDSIFEERIIIEDYKELRNTILIGFVDCIDNHRLFEFKCVQTLEKEHYLQLAIYMYMYKKYKIEQNRKFHKKKNVYEIENLGYSIKDLQRKITLINKDIYNYNDTISKFKTNCKTKTKKMELVKLLEDEVYEIKKEINDFEYEIQSISNKILYGNDNINGGNDDDDDNKYYLYNILTDEMFEIKCELSKLIEMMDFLISSKYFNKKTLTDEQFFASIELIKK